jgi:hypothetical protein
MDLEAAKTAVDSMKWQWKAKSNRFHAEMAKVETQKETIIVNQPEKYNYHHDNHNKRKVGVVRLREP